MQALTGHGAGVSFSNGATYVSDGQCTVVIAGEPHTETLQEADDGLNEKQARGLRAARLGAAATVPVPARPPAQRLWKALSDPFLRCSAAHFRLISLSAAHTNFPSPAQRVAWALLGAYAAVADAPFEEMQSSLLKGLSAVTGSFALVMHDRVRHRVVAARDKSGGVDLLWGLSANAALIFSTTSASAIGQAVNPQMFPAGCCFVSDVDANAYNTFVKLACPGSLTSFARGGQGPHPARQLQLRRHVPHHVRHRPGADHVQDGPCALFHGPGPRGHARRCALSSRMLYADDQGARAGAKG